MTIDAYLAIGLLAVFAIVGAVVVVRVVVDVWTAIRNGRAWRKRRQLPRMLSRDARSASRERRLVRMGAWR